MKNVRSRRIGTGFEQLEDRRMNAVTAELAGGALVITGDDQANKVTVEQCAYLQNNEEGELEIVNDIIVRLGNTSSSRFPAGDVQQIRVDLKGGNDDLTYGTSPEVSGFGLPSSWIVGKPATLSLGEGTNLCQLKFGDVFSPLSIDVIGGGGRDSLYAQFGRLFNGALTLNASLGSGDDYASTRLIADSAALSHKTATFRLMGEAGNDQLYFHAIPSNFSTGTGVDVDLTSVLDVGLFGGADRDYLAFYYRGILDGRLNLQMSGGSGKDDQLWADMQLLRGSEGSFHAQLWDYDSGDDAIHFRLGLYSRDVEGRVDISTRPPSGSFSNSSPAQQLATPAVQRPPASDPPAPVSPVDAFFSAGGLAGIGRRASLGSLV